MKEGICDLCGEAMPHKKEFKVQWVQHTLGESLYELTLREQDYFDGANYNFHLPEGIKFSDLTAFHGKKTRVTIEVIP